jgi:tRNA1(Val) A37 N6-methylase TrmN6
MAPASNTSGSGMKTTIDDFLNHKLALEQPKEGYRIAIDSLFLAAFCPVKSGERVLDMGCGVGGALLPLAFRVKNIDGMGLEIQPDLAELCRLNIERNRLSFLDVVDADATALPLSLFGMFDHVIANPPYYEIDGHDPSPNKIKRNADSEELGSWSEWLSSAAKALKHEGCFTFIHQAERKEEILSSLKDKGFGGVVLRSLCPKEGKVPIRILVRAKKGAPWGYTEGSPFILHEQDGRYTSAADRILRDGLAMD